METIWDRVQQLEGAVLVTLHRAKSFTVVEVRDDCVRVRPAEGSGAVRSVRRDRIEHLAGLGLQRDEFRARAIREFPDSRNTSYIAALAFEATQHAEAGVA